MKKMIVICMIQFISGLCFAVQPEFYVFDKATSDVGFCKDKPPKLFELKKIGSDKIQVSELTPKREPYKKESIYMDLDTLAMVESGAKPPRECWYFHTLKLDFPVLVKNVERNKSYTLYEPLILKAKPSTKTEIKLKNATYVIDFPAFDPLNMNGTVEGMRPKNVSVKSGNWNCVIASVPYLDDKDGVDILIAADFNGDSLPDFILDSAAKGINYSVVLSDDKNHSCKSTPALQHPPGD